MLNAPKLLINLLYLALAGVVQRTAALESS